MKKIFCRLAFALVISTATATTGTNAPPRYNVLFLISDDMRAELGCYDGLAKTPNLDRLAAAGVRFDRAYAQYPLCCPSRSSMLTGRAPTHTGVLGNRTWFGDLHPEFVSLPRWFKDHGYVTARSGKIFHDGIDDTDAWAEGGDLRFLAGAGSETNAAYRARLAVERHPPRIIATGGGATNQPANVPANRAAQADSESEPSPSRSDRWLVFAGDGETDHDYRVANKTIEQLGKYKNQPFFIACGFAKPHSPPGAPQKCYDLYDLAKIPLPPDFAPRPTVPEGFPKLSIRPRNADLFIGRAPRPRRRAK